MIRRIIFERNEQLHYDSFVAKPAVSWGGTSGGSEVWGPVGFQAFDNRLVTSPNNPKANDLRG
jgi:hypothetical protein